MLIPAWRGAPAARPIAWLSALLVLAWFATHLTLRWHGGVRARRDLSHELRFKLEGGAHSQRRQADSRRSAEGWYGGRSHSGVRPRFD